MQNISELFPQSVVLLIQKPLHAFALFRLAETYLRATPPDKKLIWATTEQPAEKVPLLFEEYGYDILPYAARILFLDMISAPAGVKRKAEAELNVSYVESPNNMTELTTTLSDLFADPAVGLAVIDSLNGIFAFNKVSNVLKFARFLPTIAYRTDTTILATYLLGEHGPEIETALKGCADAVLIAGKKEIEVWTRTGVERIKI